MPTSDRLVLTDEQIAVLRVAVEAAEGLNAALDKLVVAQGLRPPAPPDLRLVVVVDERGGDDA